MKRYLSVLLILLVLLTATTVQAQRWDAPAFGQRGPHAVGTMELTVDEMPVTMWYPALNPDEAEEAHAYDVTYPNWPPITVYGRALAEAEPAMEGGPYPLIIFTHGAYSFRYHSIYLCEHLASHGFVVMSADHMDNLGTYDGNPYFVGNLHAVQVGRPAEVSAQIDYAEAGDMADLIDAENVAVIGHSRGGVAALTVGGARFNTTAQAAACEAGLAPEPSCEAILSNLEAMAELVGVEAVPEGLWPSMLDPRVDAIVPIGPDTVFFGAEGLGEVDVPTMMLFASTDEHPSNDFDATFEALGSADKAVVVLENAAHMVFANDCASSPFMAEIGFSAMCSDPVWDSQRAHDLTDHFVTAFLLYELKGNAEAGAALAPDAVAFLGVSYDADMD